MLLVPGNKNRDVGVFLIVGPRQQSSEHVFYQLHRLRLIKQSLHSDSLKQLVFALVLIRLDSITATPSPLLYIVQGGPKTGLFFRKFVTPVCVDSK